MKIPKRVLSTILTVVLISMSVGGAGYVGYSVLFGSTSGSGHGDAMANNSSSQVTQTASLPNGSTNEMPMGNTANPPTQPASGQQAMMPNAPTQPTSGQQAVDVNAQSQTPVSGQQVAYNPEGIKQSAVILQSKSNLTNAIVKINDAITIMTLDPYALKTEDQSDMDMENAQTDNPAQSNSQAMPNASEQASKSSTDTIMQNMGGKYDVEKMTQLHAGLYKMTIGKVLLDQLSNELGVQAELAYKNTLSPLQFYVDQYNLTMQYNTKLNQAFAYVNDAVNLVNINPYVSAEGTAYDSVRMENIHQSVYKLAEGVAALRILGDDFTTQAISLAGMVQAANMNVAATQPEGTQAANHNTQTADTANQTALGNLFSNINASGVVNVLLIVFVAGLILGIIGFIVTLVKNSGKERVNT